MVSPMPLEDPPPTGQTTTEEPFVEQFYPPEMSWYSAEGPQGAMAALGRWIRENPWKAMGAAAGTGMILALVALPRRRAASAGCSCCDEASAEA